MRTRSQRRIRRLNALKRRSWEDKMVINKISILPTRMKFKELFLVVCTWFLWLATIAVLATEGIAILYQPIKFGWTGIELLQLLAIIFLIQILIYILYLLREFPYQA